MEHSRFYIGLEFWCDGRRYRCTDVGSRVIVAIRVDGAEIVVSDNGRTETHSLSGGDAEAQGWFSGPPFAVAERVLDEYDLEACSLEAAGWA